MRKPKTCFLLGCVAAGLMVSFVAQAADQPATGPVSPEPAVFANTVVWVPDVQRAADFYTKVFGIKVLFKMDLGTHWWLEMNSGVTHLSFASEKQAMEFTQGKLHRNRKAAVPAAIALTMRVKDLQAALQRATTAGGVVVAPPKQQPWGLVEARVRDPDGVLVAVVSPVTANK